MSTSFKNLVKPTTATLELADDKTGKPLGVFITAHTPDSGKWRNTFKNSVGKKTQQMTVDKTGKMVVDLEINPDAYEDNLRNLAEVVINIEGISDWEFSRENVTELFMNDGCAWIVRQFEEYMKGVSGFLEKPETTPQSTSDA